MLISSTGISDVFDISWYPKDHIGRFNFLWIKDKKEEVDKTHHKFMMKEKIYISMKLSKSLFDLKKN